MLRLSPTSFIKLLIFRCSPACCLSNRLKRKKMQMDAGERRITRELDIIHFIQNAIFLKTLTKLSLSKTDRCLVRRQPKVHLLDRISSASSDSTQIPTTNAYSQGDLSNYSLKLLDLYFATKDKASSSISPEQRSPSVVNTVSNWQH